MTLYDFILQTFDEAELLALCDNDQELKKAKVDFSMSMPMGEKVRRLINFCERHGLESLLRSHLKQARSMQWERHNMDGDNNRYVVKKPLTDGEADFSEMLANAESSTISPEKERPLARPLRIFISYASEDRSKVIKLYESLRKDGFSPWLDVQELLPGQRWDDEISIALENSDIVLVCLSENAVTKEGYVQKEIKKALDKALEMPEGNVFLIPTRLDDCKVPRNMQQYQWVDLFEEGGYLKLVKSLQLRVEQISS